jgi:hypothetical protein
VLAKDRLSGAGLLHKAVVFGYGEIVRQVGSRVTRFGEFLPTYRADCFLWADVDKFVWQLFPR